MRCATFGQLTFRSAVLTLLASVCLVRTTHAAAPLDSAVPALKLVPADASFCSVWLRNREQLEIAANSKAWAEFQAIPYVQFGMTMAAMQMQSPESPLQQILADPANRQLLDLLKSMVADEMFVYGGAGVEKPLSLLSDIQAANQLAQLSALGQAPPERVKQQAVAALQTLIDRRADIAIPQLVIGFRTPNQDAAKAQLARLEQLAGMLPQLDPRMKGRVTRAKIGNGDYLTLQLDGSLVPWDQMPRDEIPVDTDEFEKLIQHLKGLKLAISFGLADKYLIISIAESTKHLATLGTGKNLASTPELTKLAPYADRRLTNISYVGKELMSHSGFGSSDLSQIKTTAGGLVEGLGLDEELQKRILADVDEYANDLQPYLGDAGAVAGCQFITERGLESFTYNWGKNPVVDASKPLTLLEHVGGAPLVAVVTRMKQSPDQYKTSVKWLKKAYAYLEEFAIPNLDDDKRTQVREVLERLKPLFARLDSAMAKKFVPAMADGQAAFVLDAKSTSKQWIEQLPPTRSALPMLELAIVYGVADASLLEQAMAEFRAIINEAIPIIAELGDGQIDPEASLPAPEVKPVDGGKIFFYKLPKHLGIDKQVAPNAGLGKSVAVLSLIPKHTVRLMTKTPVSSTGPLAAAKRPLGSAAYVNIAGLIDAVSPWIDVAVAAAQSQRADSTLRNNFVANQAEAEDVGEPAELDPNVQQVLDQVHALLNVLKVFSSYSSVTYPEKDVWVTNGELRIIDAK